MELIELTINNTNSLAVLGSQKDHYLNVMPINPCLTKKENIVKYVRAVREDTLPSFFTPEPIETTPLPKNLCLYADYCYKVYEEAEELIKSELTTRIGKRFEELCLGK